MVYFKFNVRKEIIKLHFFFSFNQTLMNDTISILVPERNRIDLTPKNLKLGNFEGRISAFCHRFLIFKITGNRGQGCHLCFPKRCSCTQNEIMYLRLSFPFSQMTVFHNSVISLEARVFHHYKSRQAWCVCSLMQND